MFWTKKRDKLALELWGTEAARKSYSAQKAAEIIGHGCTRGMVIGRVSRLLGKKFPSTEIRKKASRARSLRKASMQESGLKILDRDIRNGVPRETAIRTARTFGLGSRAIAKAMGYKAHETISRLLRPPKNSPKAGVARAQRGTTNGRTARSAH